MIDMRLGDCMDLMRGLPDKAFDLAIVDPPYGIGASHFEGFDAVKRQNGTVGQTKRPRHTPKEWDVSAPDEAYFSELFRVSRDQIIWGGNYFPLPPTRGIVCWDKCQPFETFSAWELAWTSFESPASLIRLDNKGFMNADGSAIHPTQKPVALYKWLLTRYAKPRWTILDTHGGSGSIAIACHDLGFDLTWIEKDHDYYEAATKRYQTHAAQLHLFDPAEKTDTEPLDLDL